MKLVLATIGVLVFMLLMLGASETAPEPKFRAYAKTLSPTPYVAPEPPAVVERQIVRVPQEAAQKPVSGGTAGHIMGGSNCVACAQALTGRAQSGNAGSHRPSSSTPWVGAIMIFYPGEQGASGAGHVGVVTGVIGGKIQLAHCNWGGGQTVFASTGKFY